jgi:hypothetical protein
VTLPIHFILDEYNGTCATEAAHVMRKHFVDSYLSPVRVLFLAYFRHFCVYIAKRFNCASNHVPRASEYSNQCHVVELRDSVIRLYLVARSGL